MATTLRPGGSIVSSKGGTGRALSICLFASLVCTSLPGIDRDRRLDELHHTSWTIQEGAPSEIFGIAQTTDGYLWLGTTTGLVRFDGIHFENYESPFGETFAGNNAMALLATADGGLWIGFSTGATSFLKNGRITNYGAKEGMLRGSVRALVKDRQGHVWAAGLGGLLRFDGSKWKRIAEDLNFAGGATAALVDRAGTLWVGTQDGVLVLSEGAAKFQTAAAGMKYVTSLAEAPDGTVWASQLRGPIRPVRAAASDKSLQNFLPFSLKVFFDNRGSLWAATLGTGVWRVAEPERLASLKEAERKTLLEQYTRSNGLTSGYIQNVFQDSEGDIWIGTNAGLDRFRQSAVSSLPSGPYIALAKGAAGTVWVAPSSDYVRLIHNRRILDKFPPELPPFRRSANCMYRDRKGDMWLGTDPNLVRISGRQITEFKYPRGTKSDADGQGAAVAITEAQPDGMWISMLGEVIYRFVDGNWTSIETLGGPKSIAISAFTDPNGVVWLGLLDKTLVRIDGAGIRVFAAKDGLTSGRVRAIHAGGGKAWIGGDEGVSRFDGGSFRKLNPAEGSLRDVFGVVETDDGLWLNESRGIVRIPHSELLEFEKDASHKVQFRVFGFLDGLAAPLQKSSANPALIQSSDGLLWFATAQGVAYVDPTRIPKNTVPPPVTITSVAANSRFYLPSDGLALPERVQNLQLDYVGISLAMPERVKYRYKLDGYDTDWQEAGPRRQAFYTNPGPGSYTFRVRAVNPDGVWNESGASIVFSIAPAFYETWWFRLLAALAVAGIIWTLYLLRLRLVTAQLQARLGERLMERERIARELHDTLLQSFQGLMLRLQVVDDLLSPGKAKEQLEQSLARGDQAIAEGRTAVYNLRSASSGKDLPDALRTAAGEFVADGTATFSLVVEGSVRDLHPILRDDVYRIACEALRNAFAHAHARQIETEVTYADRSFVLRIRDDGEGIPAEILEVGRRGHYGLAGMRERATQIGGKLEIWSGAGAGTEIELSIPGSIAYAAPARRSLRRLLRKKAD